MAQHDYVIDNGTGAAVRSDLNNALSAIVTHNSGATAPATTYAFQLWADTTTNTLKLRNAANSAWIELRQLDGDFTSVSVDNGSAAAPSIFFNASGTDTGIYSSGTDAIDFSAAGTRRFGIASGGDLTVYGGNVTLNAQGDLRFADSDSSNWVAFQSPATVSSNVTWTLPSADGTNGQALTTNGSGTLSWTSPASTTDNITAGNTNATVVDTGSDGHFKVTTEGTERLRIDSSGRCGIGTSSPRLRTHIRGDSAGAPTLGAASGSLIVGPNDNDYGMMFGVAGAGWGWIQAQNFITPGGTAYNLALQPSGGNVGIGTSTPGKKLDISQSTTSTTAINAACLQLVNTENAVGYYSGVINFCRIDSSTPMAYIGSMQADTSGYSANHLVFGTRNGAATVDERMRIQNDGTILMGSSGSTGVERLEVAETNYSSNGYCLLTKTTGSGTKYHIRFVQAASVVGSVTSNGSATAYNTSSDYRLKENIVPLTGAAYRVNQLQVHRFNFIADPDKTVDGFIAHEAQAVVPECVTGEKDAVDDDGNPVYQGIDQSKLVPLLTAALQEALAEIESLKARVTALEP